MGTPPASLTSHTGPSGYGVRMSMTPRGPLPAGVYWRRRALVLLVAVILVLFLVKLIGGGSDAESDEDDAATQVAATHDPEVTTSAGPTATGTADAAPKPRRTKTPLAEPDGPCDPADVKIGLATRRVANDGDVELVLALTGNEAACTFTVSPDTVALKIVSGSDNIWYGQHCPDTIPTADVVVRSAVEAKVRMTWNGRRSAPECSRNTDWALPGSYHLIAAAFGGDPVDTQFELTRPGPVTVTVTPTPEQKKQD